jgi:hypothetical protein
MRPLSISVCRKAITSRVMVSMSASLRLRDRVEDLADGGKGSASMFQDIAADLVKLEIGANANARHDHFLAVAETGSLVLDLPGRFSLWSAK